MPETIYPCDILVVGAGFAGSLTALALHNLGFRVCLVEKGQHPRFTIGESSTPVADMILRDLSAKYNLPWLYDFSRYGSWQRSHPEIVCGIKRGFSFFKHYPGKDFYTDADHSNELLVAASADDVQSDTNWLRADFDAFLVNKVIEAGIPYFDRTEIVSAKRHSDWQFVARHDGTDIVFQADFMVDATGDGMMAENLFGIRSDSGGFLTDSFAIFSHFNDVPRWTDTLKTKGIPVGDFPYDPDNSALHQVLDEGWMWMLRFNDRRTSIGFVLDGNRADGQLSTDQLWNDLLQEYPAIHQIIDHSSLSSVPGRIIRSGRLQRRLTNCLGEGWTALPHTAGFVDPLFSSGIAHSLTGIERLVDILHKHWGRPALLQDELKAYEHKVFEELKLTDQLVAGCYKTMAHFDLFNTWSMLYFAATITYEQRRLKQEEPGYFLSADDPYIRGIVQTSWDDLLRLLDNAEPSTEDVHHFNALVRERIRPVNTAGLMDPASKNMYYHTVAKL
ncbi:MAG TPA: FAD-dependent oxidoreductase [Mucilaginibacter sp.]|nr:FAD-dependent oxidoreductase [Mucilaginibacter sp.]